VLLEAISEIWGILGIRITIEVTITTRKSNPFDFFGDEDIEMRNETITYNSLWWFRKLFPASLRVGCPSHLGNKIFFDAELLKDSRLSRKETSWGIYSHIYFTSLVSAYLSRIWLSAPIVAAMSHSNKEMKTDVYTFDENIWYVVLMSHRSMLSLAASLYHGYEKFIHINVLASLKLRCIKFTFSSYFLTTGNYI
jgi:hypothetical protein